MANATPQKTINVQLTRSQLKLLKAMLDLELSTLETGYAHPNPAILRSTYVVIREHLQPSAKRKQQRFQAWVNRCGSRRAAAVFLDLQQAASLSGAATC